jgi:sec-independent protein translocase protein TatC
VFLVWGLTLIGGMFVGSLVGFFFVAPWIISWFVSDALTASMVISYRLNSFMWLVIFTTLGIGLLADVPLTMLLFDRGGIVSYGTMRKRWRVVVLGAFVLAGLVIPGGTITMFVLAIPMCLAYAAGLALLWVVTLPRRLGGGGRGGAGDDEPTVVG